MRFHILRAALVFLCATLAACGGGSDKRQAADASQQTARPTPTEEPYSFIRRVSVAELRDALNDGSAVAVDVRNWEEYRARAIKGAVHIDELLKGEGANESTRAKLFVTYCDCPAERTSARAALELQQKGLSNVAALRGGYEAWDDANLPTGPGGKPGSK